MGLLVLLVPYAFGAVYQCPGRLFEVPELTCWSRAGACKAETVAACSNEPRRLPANLGQPCPVNDCGMPDHRYSLTECDLMALMGNECCDHEGANLCSQYLDAILTNLESYNLNCPARIAGYLAQIRHETASLQTMFQCRDNGAGAIHMIPVNYRVACEQLPNLKAAFVARYGTSLGCNGGADPEASQIVSCPNFAFETAGWWMSGGGSVCPNDVLVDELDKCATVGTDDSGFRKVSRCILGVSDPGQRDQFYLDALALARDFPRQDNSSVVVDKLITAVNASALVLPPEAERCNLWTACSDSSQCCSAFGFCGSELDGYCGPGCQNGPCLRQSSVGIDNMAIALSTYVVGGVFFLASVVLFGVAWRVKTL